MRKPASYGFTLLELTVVLVIVALAAGGIIMGSTMIRHSQMQEAISEYDRYAKALQQFQDKYNSLPGDMANATGLWGVMAGCPTPAYAATPPTTPNTCNGNGDGKIGFSASNGNIFAAAPVSGVMYYETRTAWQHLANAGLIDGRYTGRPGNGAQANSAVPGLNAPSSEISPAGWSITEYRNTAGGTDSWPDNYGHILSLGAVKDGWLTANPAITPSEAAQIDMKIDDGAAGTGKVRVWRPPALGNNNCASDVSQSSATYLSTNTTVLCSIFFLMGF